MSDKGFDSYGTCESHGPTMKPIPLTVDAAKTERVSTYVELPVLKFLEQYKLRLGSRGVSEVIRRLIIIGAAAEGYEFDGKDFKYKTEAVQ